MIVNEAHISGVEGLDAVLVTVVSRAKLDRRRRRNRNRNRNQERRALE